MADWNFTGASVCQYFLVIAVEKTKWKLKDSLIFEQLFEFYIGITTSVFLVLKRVCIQIRFTLPDSDLLSKTN